jgi:hypothetical protein
MRRKCQGSNSQEKVRWIDVFLGRALTPPQRDEGINPRRMPPRRERPIALKYRRASVLIRGSIAFLIHGLPTRMWSLLHNSIDQFADSRHAARQAGGHSVRAAHA